MRTGKLLLSITIPTLILAAVVGAGPVFFRATVSQALDSESKEKPEILEPSGDAPVEAWREYVDDVYSRLRVEPPTAPDGSPIEVIYGDDNRKDYYDMIDPDLLVATEAVCLVVGTSSLTDNGDGTYTLAASPWIFQSGSTVCADERFRGQLAAGFCTAFLVGDDILVTAGHCVSSSSCGSTAFVFGFRKTDSVIAAPTLYSADDVYFCSGIIDRRLAGDRDHCVLQLDRPVLGRTPLPIRRTGSVADGDPLSVIGHGIILPVKEAGGAIVQNANGAVPYFQSNLDTYGGNSGSPVFSLTTYVVEGILVRGAPDFVYDPEGNCTRSNTVPNTGNTGAGLTFEEVSKTTEFAASIPPLLGSAGTITLGRNTYSCDDILSIEVEDSDLRGAGTDSAVVTASDGDTEVVSLTETPPGSGIFTGALATAPGTPVSGNGILNVGDAETILAAYYDADNGTGVPDTMTDSAATDCIAPTISNVSVQALYGTEAWIAFDTDEAATGTVHYGTECAVPAQSTNGPGQTTSHLIILTGLAPETAHLFSVEAVDAAGNSQTDDDGGLCYSFTTPFQPDYFTEQFTSDNDLNNQQLIFAPDGSPDFYEACRKVATAFPTDPAGGTVLSLGDDDSIRVLVTGGMQVSLYGISYTEFIVSSNGYITFNSGSVDFSEALSEHFGPLPHISGLYDDLNLDSGGVVSYKQLGDRVAVTFENVPEWLLTNSNSFQFEMFFDGTIAITHLNIDASDGLVGISDGNGLPPDFVESDLSGYPLCPCDGVDGDGDGICDTDDNCPYFANPDQTGCPFHGDPVPDGVTDILDLVYFANVAFREGAPIIDSTCPHAPAGRTDVDCDGDTDIIDLVLVADVAFREAPKNFCNPCACDPYPSGCP